MHARSENYGYAYTYNIIRSRPTLGRAYVLPINLIYLFIFFLYQSTVLSSRTAEGYQMYFGGSVIGKVSTIGIDISPTPPLIFTGVKMCGIWSRFQHHSTLSRPRLKMQQDI